MSDPVSKPTPSLAELTARFHELNLERLERRRAKLTHTEACDDGDENGELCDECVFLERLDAASEALSAARLRTFGVTLPPLPPVVGPAFSVERRCASPTCGARGTSNHGEICPMCRGPLVPLTPAQRQAIPVITTPATLTEAAQAFSASTKAALPKELTHAYNADPSAPLEVPVVTAICSPPTVTVEPMTDPAPTAVEAVMHEVDVVARTTERVVREVAEFVRGYHGEEIATAIDQAFETELGGCSSAGEDEAAHDRGRAVREASAVPTAEAVMGQVLALLGTLEHMLTDVTAKVAFATRLEQFFGPLIADKQPPIDGALIATRAELDAAIDRLARKHHNRLAALEQEVAELRGAGVVSRAARAARRALALVGGGK